MSKLLSGRNCSVHMERFPTERLLCVPECPNFSELIPFSLLDFKRPFDSISWYLL